MNRRAAQLNIRSDAARRRVAELVAATGKSATQVVEDALQTYRPPPPVERAPLPEGFIYRNEWIVQTNAAPMTLEQHLAVIDDVREDRVRHIMGEDVD
jgi:hypothetical protein